MNRGQNYSLCFKDIEHIASLCRSSVEHGSSLVIPIKEKNDSTNTIKFHARRASFFGATFFMNENNSQGFRNYFHSRKKCFGIF